LELSRPCLDLRKGVAEVLEAEKTPKHKVNTKIHPLLRCNLALDPLGMSLECLALTSSTAKRAEEQGEEEAEVVEAVVVMEAKRQA
ncbi:hypothetical protein CLOM_g13974, partial [Closterium sp. NIES-68]